MKSKRLSDMTEEELKLIVDACWLKIEQGDDPFNPTYWFYIQAYEMRVRGGTHKVG